MIPSGASHIRWMSWELVTGRIGEGWPQQLNRTGRFSLILIAGDLFLGLGINSDRVGENYDIKYLSIKCFWQRGLTIRERRIDQNATKETSNSEFPYQTTAQWLLLWKHCRSRALAMPIPWAMSDPILVACPTIGGGGDIVSR